MEAARTESEESDAFEIEGFVPRLRDPTIVGPVALLYTQHTSTVELKEGQALRSKSKQHQPARELWDYSQLIQELIVALTNLTKTQSQGFYREQGLSVLQVLKQAYLKGENNSMLLLARSKQTLHSFISAATEEITRVLQGSGEDSGGVRELKVIRVNSILLNSETKILLKLAESLKLKAAGLQQAMAAKA
jgi:hypothetical protein